jgi:sortase A
MTSTIGSRRLVVALAVAVATVVVTGATVINASRGDGEPARRVAVATTTTAPATTTTARPTTTTIPLPMPEDAPTDPYADVPVVQIGTISIPEIGLVHALYEGIWLTVLDHGPGHWPGSAEPGRRGNTVVAGHRVTHTHPFLDLDLLVPGDRVIFTMPDGVFTYAVTGTTIVTPDEISIVYPTPKPTMTLFACHPKHSAAERIVVKGKLVSSRPKPAGRHA